MREGPTPHLSLGPAGQKLLRAIVRPVRSAGAGLRALKASKLGMTGLSLVGFWVLVAIFAPLIAPYDPLTPIVPLQPPGTVMPEGQVLLLGTDLLGRDILSRIIFGSRTVLVYAPLATFCAYVVGCVMGLAAGYLRGWWDEVLSFTSNVVLSFPVIVLYVVVIATFGPSGLNIVLAVTFASAPAVMRIIRGLTLDLSNREYIAAARTRGEGFWWIVVMEILPNARAPLIADACLRLGYVTITIGVLGFLGLGLPPPTPDWGGMINEGRSMAMVFPHAVFFPCIAISSLILGFNLLADGIREVSAED